jgi:hypothetical protein
MNYLERKLNAGWHSLFDSGSSFYLPGQLPQNYTASDVLTPDGKDLNVTIPDIWIILGQIPQGDAYAFVPSATVNGINSLHPDPAQPDLSFDSTDSNLTAHIQWQALAATGQWRIRQAMENSTGCVVPKMSATLRAVAMARGGSVPGAAIALEDNTDALFRKLEQDLLARGGAMGQWYVAQYNANRQALSDLLDIDQFKKAIQYYHGDQIWQAIQTTIQEADQGFQFPEQYRNDAMNLVSAAIDLTTSDNLATSISEVLDYVPQYIGKNYEQVIQVVAQHTPPQTSHVAAAPPQARAASFARASAGDIYYRFWQGMFDISTTASASINVNIITGEDGTAPTLQVTSLDVTLSDFRFTYYGQDFQSALEVWLQQYFKPDATQGMDKIIKDKVEQDTTLKQTISTYLTNAVKKLWDNPLPPH